MARKTDRIIIDTNLWISFLITKNFKALDIQIKTGKMKILFSLELMEEFLSVANRPKFKRYFTKDDIEQLIDLFDLFGETVQVRSKIKLCRDPKDDFLLALAIDSKADYLITGDNELLELKAIEKTKIVTITDYMSLRSSR
ncbi:MAG: putative toxin-antitoxin system toxin component, PIN family [Cyclobacteriaceae bacterium]|nr:putative toxin-antitoxin system toxin component, PIN family [Cyclobacteriaceae bacterium]